MHQFPEAKLKALLADLEKFRPKGRAVAAFDADGTLWNADLGEAFFQYQIDNGLVPLPPNPWDHYHGMKEKISRTAAYVWLAQILKDVPLDQVRLWAETSVASQPLPVFAEIPVIFDKLKELDVEIYIVTASIKWAVEPGARRLGLGDASVLGIETAVVDGKVTDQPHGIVTFREGKAKALLAQTGGLHPYFCAGNTEGDHFLLEAASNLRLVMSAAPPGTENFKSESKMLAIAAERDWYFHRYI